MLNKNYYSYRLYSLGTLSVFQMDKQKWGVPRPMLVTGDTGNNKLSNLPNL